MGNTVACSQNAEDTLDRIESIHPENWTQSEVVQWLKLTHDGDLVDLVQPFKANKISGLSFLRLTNESLKQIGVKQFGLRDAFISARDQVLRDFEHRQQNPAITLASINGKDVPLNTTVTANDSSSSSNSSHHNKSAANFSTHGKGKTYQHKLPSTSQTQTQSEYFASDEFIDTKYSTSSNPKSFNMYNNNTTSTFRNVSSLSQVSETPISPSHSGEHHQLSFEQRQPFTSSDVLSTNTKYLYTDLCHLLIAGYGRQSATICTAHTKLVSSLIFDYYFEYERHIEQFGHDLWKTLVFIEISTIANGKDIIRGFSGYRLIKHIKQYLQRYVTQYSRESEIEQLCAALIKHSYIRLAAITDEHARLIEKLQEYDKRNFSKNVFVNSKQHLYQFENERHREFIKSDEPDRQAWYKSCVVQIYSSTLQGWTVGTVVDIQEDLVTVQYGGSQKQQTQHVHHQQQMDEELRSRHSSQTQSQQMRKTVDRYQDNVVKSTPQFIYARKNWSKDSEVQVFSNQFQAWFLGRVIELIPPKHDQLHHHDIFKVSYNDRNGREFHKYLERWSCFLREVQSEKTVHSRANTHHSNKQPANSHQQLSQLGVASPTVHHSEHCQYAQGSQVMVWSNSKQMWMAGIVTQIVYHSQIVNVRYGEFEKLMPWNSPDLRLPAY